MLGVQSSMSSYSLPRCRMYLQEQGEGSSVCAVVVVFSPGNAQKKESESRKEENNQVYRA